MQNKTIYLFPNPNFDTRAHHGISKLYQIFCNEYGYKVYIIDKNFLQNHTPEGKYSQLLVIAGGDGTIHQAINSIPENMLDKYVFGIIPGGTANELAKAVKMPKSIIKSAAIIANPKTLNYCYLGCVNNQYRFATGFLYGVADYVLKITPTIIKHILGEFAFHYGTIKLIYKMLRQNKNKYKKFKINSEVHTTNYLLINNLSLTTKNLTKKEIGHEYSNLLYMVYIKSGLTNFELLKLLFRNITHKEILTDKHIHYSQHKEILIESEENFEFILDGERYQMKGALTINHLENPIAIISG